LFPYFWTRPYHILRGRFKNHVNLFIGKKKQGIAGMSISRIVWKHLKNPIYFVKDDEKR